MDKRVIYTLIGFLATCMGFFFIYLGFAPFPVPSFKVDDKKEVRKVLVTAPWEPELYRVMYERAEIPDIEETIRGGIVPHHLLAGYMAASFFEALKKQQPSTIVLLGPDHFSRGVSAVTVASNNWKTPFGIQPVNGELVDVLVEKTVATEMPDVLSEEHSVYGVVPFIKKSLPKTRLIPIVVREGATTEELETVRDVLLAHVPSDTVFVASIDFSHYQNVANAQFHDRLSQGVIRSFDFDRIGITEIDSHASLELFLRLMEAKGTQHISHEIMNDAGSMVGDPQATNITSYYTPFFVNGEPNTSRTASMLFFGDMMLDRSVALAMEDQGIDYLLKEIAGEEGRFFKGMDIIAANLEGPFATTRIQTSKEIAFRFDPILAPQLATYGFNLVSLANNHTLDMGRAAVEETRQVLTDAGIAYYGHQTSTGDDAVLYQEIGGFTFAFIGVHETYPYIDMNPIVEHITKAEDQADYTIVNAHWGVEYEPLSYTRQRELAHKFIDAGADVIIGHHPHVVQEIEIYKEKPIFYSLGNFVFDQYFSIPTQQSLGVGLVFDEDAGLHVFVMPLKGERSKVLHMNKQEAGPFMQSLIDRSRLGAYTFDTIYSFFIPS